MLTNKELMSYCDELHSLKGSVSQLQSAINGIVASSPSTAQYKQLEDSLEGKSINNPLVERTRNLLYSPQARVGVRLKQLYSADRLPIFTLINKINFRAQKGDKYVGYLVDYTPPKATKETLSLITQESQIHESTVTGWLDPEANYPPSLPPLDNQILKLVLTDKSYRQPSDFIQSVNYRDFSLIHNGKLALRGAKTLDNALMEIVDEKLPHLHEDDLYMLVYKLTCTNILTRFAIGYNIIDKMNSLTSVDGLTIKEKAKILSRAFLAYIGGMTMKNAASEYTYSFEEIKIWIFKLYEPIISECYKSIESNGNLFQFNKICKSELSFLLGDDENLTYELTSVDPVFVVEVKYKEKSLGVGTSSISEDEASLKAAEMALSNKEELIDLLKIEKRIFCEMPSVDDKDKMPEQFESHQSISEDHHDDAEILGSTSTPLMFAKKNLNIVLKKHNLVPIYKYSKQNNDHCITVIVDDLVLGKAIDANKKMAGQKAATIALANKDLLNVLFSRSKALEPNSDSPSTNIDAPSESSNAEEETTDAASSNNNPVLQNSQQITQESNIPSNLPTIPAHLPPVPKVKPNSNMKSPSTLPSIPRLN